MRFASVLTVLVFSFFYSEISFGRAYFEKLSYEWDSNCPNWDLSRFRNVETYFTVGVSGAEDYGFDYEFPISRVGVDYMLCAAQGNSHGKCSKVRPNSSSPYSSFKNESAAINSYIDYDNKADMFNDYFDFISDEMELEGVYSVNVGSMLEYLSRLLISDYLDVYPRSIYEITGSVEYSQGGPTIGELDIIVYNKFTCNVVAIGESKASKNSSMRKALSKAKNQLRRFRSFLQRNL